MISKGGEEMKKVVALILTIALVLTASSAFAAKGKVRQAGSSHEKTLFQIAADTMTEAYNAREKHPWKDITVFEDSSENIATLDNMSANAKVQSLRGNRGELARRRNVR